MLVSSVLLYLNLTPRLDVQNVYVKGWPYSVLYSFGFAGNWTKVFQYYWDGSSITYVLLNTVEAALILLVTFCISEWLIRRRDGRKP